MAWSSCPVIPVARKRDRSHPYLCEQASKYFLYVCEVRDKEIECMSARGSASERVSQCVRTGCQIISVVGKRESAHPRLCERASWCV